MSGIKPRGRKLLGAGHRGKVEMPRINIKGMGRTAVFPCGAEELNKSCCTCKERGESSFGGTIIDLPYLRARPPFTDLPPLSTDADDFGHFTSLLQFSLPL